jgi:hypothetical protein
MVAIDHPVKGSLVFGIIRTFVVQFFLWLSGGQLFKRVVDRFKLVGFTHGNQHLGVFVVGDFWLPGDPEHLPAGLDGGGNVFHFVTGFKIRRELVKPANDRIVLILRRQVTEKTPD